MARQQREKEHEKKRAIDLRYLSPWARHILTDDEARDITRPVTIDEVKTALFDIEEDKAPGPDGFSSGFFKAAWPVVGVEVSKAIIDFFKTGRLLKQLNATLLTLIPKVRTPHSVVDFRPISCCNVVYKVISKILVSRIREILDLLISPSQNAFVPGRLISDNILLAQELFSGYNQCGLRSVTSAHYSVVVNGGVHGFFAGARGLRQGEPMSPYLFVLVIEVLHMILQQLIEQDGEFQYHWRCEDLNLFQLSFADDLLLFCKADVCSVFLFGRGLDTFATLSGLHTNPQKSQLIISKAASGLRESLLATLGFQEGHLPVRYLGLPLISAWLSVADCQPLLQKIDSRIKGWEGVQLSFVGRVQLIKSVLISFEVYWATAFILPKRIINEMIKRLRTFFGKVPLPVVTLKWLGRLFVDRLRKGDLIRLRDCSIWTVKDNKGAWGWRKMLSLRHSLVSKIHFCIGNGDSISLWHDPWHPLGPLISRFPRGPQLTNTGLLDKLSVVIKDGQWNWPMITDIACLEITYMLPPISKGPNRITWKSKDGSFNTSTAYELFHPPGPKVFWSSLLMGPFKIPKNCFILWLAIMGIVYFG
ncbi:Retrovirus-related Pol polyprotein from type-2 retrotransposable element R2DM [Sesamum angolense]|uniref:Retrovirus-related Pol polyprotein from type-2 retrotransposable element R2DM n=1 Tax=Sesamum angolense TaxID=2727404 RepID=A0AAE1TA01_9LAMI|nr:Retrovirus-related Pol polyprotein from type-2 retrotransposable element R2DM [Sesamum angolense]